FVDRRAQRRRESVVALERRHGARVADGLLGELVQLAGAHPGAGRLDHSLQSPRNDQPGGTHGLELAARLALDALAPPREQTHDRCLSASSTRAVTSAMSP